MKSKNTLMASIRQILTFLLMPAAATVVAKPITPRFEVECVLVEKAKIAHGPLKREGQFGRANHGHQIVNGGLSVLAIRIFDDPDRGPDSEIFKKATLELQRSPEVAARSEVVVDVLRSHYTEGSSGWAGDGGYRWAKDPFPEVRFKRNSDGLHATLKQKIRMNDGDKIAPRLPQLLLVEITCPVRKVSVLQLTAWTGSVGTSDLSFFPQRPAD